MGVTAKKLEEDAEFMDASDEEDEDLEQGAPIFTAELAKMKSEAEGKAFHMQQTDEDMEEDDGEALKKNQDEYPEAFSDSEEEREDFTIRKTDALIVAATADNDHSNLEVYVYEHEKANMYVHHEIILSSYPLCMEWLPRWQDEKANMIIVGTFVPEIEIWNLDSEDCAPRAVLGSFDESEKAKNQMVKKFNKKNKKGQQKPAFSETTHTDAIMSLSLNPFQNEYLASGSADCTVRVWDIDELACKVTYANIHSDKVQVCRWNRKNEQILLTGGYDGLINISDVRTAEGAACTYKLDKSVHQDIECANWHYQGEHHFVVGTESGMLCGYDIRNPKGAMFEIKAHSKGCTSVDFSPHIPSMLGTVGVDGICRIWDLNAVASSPQQAGVVHQKNMK